MLESQRTLPVEEEFRGEEANVVAGRREIEALVRPVLQEGTSNELGQAVAEGGQDFTGADIGYHRAEPVRKSRQAGGRWRQTR